MARWLLQLLTLAGAVMAMCACALPAQAQAGVAGRAVSICVRPAVAGDTAQAQFRATRFDCTQNQTSFGPGDYWVRSAPVSATGEVNIRIASLWQQRVTLYALYADGAIVALATDGQSASRHMQIGAIIERSLPVRSTALVRLLWHVEGAANLRGILVGPRIATPAQSAQSNLLMAAIYAAFAGLCIALLTHHLALWGALRHRFQLAYCAMVASLTGYALTSSGTLALLLPVLANNDRLRLNYLLLGLASSAALVFARSFFEPRVFAGWLGRLSSAVCVMIVAAAVAFAVLAPWHIGLLDRVYSGTLLGQFLIVMPILWRAWRMRSNYLWLFAICWAAPVGFACARAANAFHILPWSFWMDNSTILAMTFEALLSSLAISYRIRLLSVERDEAREQELAAKLLADTDPLTGLLNRRAFLREAIGREPQQTLLLIDIDNFKRVNETIGHDGGDEVLRVVARTLRKSVHDRALVARIGGEEFAILTDSDQPIEPEAILARLRAGRMPYDLSVTASIGACEGSLAFETDWKALYRCADRALFDAKAAGRDRVRGAPRLERPIAVAA